MSKGWINPSDCVDMDCDARRKVILTDVDGSFFGTAGMTAISQSEFGWSGDGHGTDRSWGLGNAQIFYCSKDDVFRVSTEI